MVTKEFKVFHNDDHITWVATSFNMRARCDAVEPTIYDP